MFQRILVPVDGSAPSMHALTVAIGMARAFAGRLRLVHVLEDAAYLAGYDPTGAAAGELFRATRDSGTRILAEALETARRAGVDADTVFVDQLGERLPESVAKAAREWPADLVVVGTHGRRGLSRLMLGSGAEDIIRQAPVPVLVARETSAA
ncbi:universal stress protein [Ramlibacter sp. AN1015]|uniref:universal stress protein n=1 Tax=Ramlibacter sp. AN1015 TaxID=3133428 RepID=UPI0030C05EFA